MKEICLKQIFVLLLASYCHGALADSLPLKVVGIEDGDTIVVEIKGAENRVQLSGIDAPENTDNAKFKLDIKTTGLTAETLLAIGNAATDHLKSLLPSGATVSIDANMDERDRYGRIPAIIFNSKGLQLNEKMVEDGYASMLTRYPLDADFKTRLQHKQAQAQKNNLGLWDRYPEISKIWFKN